MRKIILLASESLHREIFIRYCIKIGIEFKAVFYDSKIIKPKFDTNHFYLNDENKFESNYVNKLKPTNIKTYNLSDLNLSENRKKILEIYDDKNDIIISFGTRKLSKEFINDFDHKIVNLHRGIMEEYRGLDSNLWARYHKDYNNIGITLHYVNEFLDLGNIILQEFLDLKDVPLYKWRTTETIASAEIIKKYIQDYNILSSYELSKHGRYYSFIPRVLV
tara:strand:+ start:366 stop:1025 length:660 start_codon:yes stop_codon:yes gene_type:complete